MQTYFDNERLVFKPEGNKTLADMTYYFKVILKEEGVGALSYTHYCSVYVECRPEQCPTTPVGPGDGGNRTIDEDDTLVE